MSDTPTPNEIHACAIEQGWYEGIDIENLHSDFIPSKLALIHSEVSEALENQSNCGERRPGTNVRRRDIYHRRTENVEYANAQSSDRGNQAGANA